MKNKKTLYVGGSFNDGGGRESKLAKVIFEGLEESLESSDIDYYNGGYFNNLNKIAQNIDDYGLVFWFANVPNDKSKLVRRLKRKNKAFVLVTSKRNVEGKYGLADLVHHALLNKSNLFVEFTHDAGLYEGRVMDPLGNVFNERTKDFHFLGNVIGKRAKELMSYTRVGSERTGEKINPEVDKEFFKIIKNYAEVFHELIHPNPESASRFMGNASFRCESGFPSYRQGDLIFVSRRNVDKRGIGKDSFVGVRGNLPVEYFGMKKPSVDTPIQVRLYQHYSNVKYMLHSHTYIDGAPLTENVVPCGALEEAAEIFELFPDWKSVNFSVNLKGHGSLVLADNLDYLRGINYVARPMPEVQNYEK